MSQLFKLCQEDGGHDTCQNCPKGYTQYDTINTAIWDYQINPCVEKEDCDDYSGLKDVDGVCVCDRTNGYYGRDKYKCGVDNGGCKIAGHQLTIDGDCEECEEHFFKPEINYDLCRKKTSCGPGQEIDDSGSSSRDRTCRQKAKINPTILPDKKIPGPGHNKVKNEENNLNGEVKNTTKNIQDAGIRNTSVNTPGESTNHDTRFIVAGLSISLVGILLLSSIAYMCCYRRKKKGQNDITTDQPNTIFNCICCPKTSYSPTEINFRPQNAQFGDNNTVKVYNEKDENDQDVEEDTPLKEDADDTPLKKEC
ncbi:uncharacterized protein LOC143057463 [Mytilus galloprovincialis]|uniref:uncharacterized protein LOC143057463 n=1 Tax=Mytilus galloprovincialis TaxID=29158 RepID=UPI003F7B417C